MRLATAEQRQSIRARREARKAELAALSAKARATEAQRVKDNRAALAAGPVKPRKSNTDAQPKKHNKHEESDMQKACVRWFRMQYKRELLLSFPNASKLAGTKKERAMRAGIMKAEGMLPGASDLVLIHDGGVVFLEAKTPTGKLRQTQREFRAMVEAMGYKYFVFRSVKEFVEIVNKVLQQPC